MDSMRSLCAWLGALAPLFVLAQCYGQGTFTRITFDGPPLQPPGTAYNVQQYYESKMSFTPLPGTAGLGRVGRPTANTSDRPDNGTAFLDADITESLQFSAMNGSPFSLVSVDLAEYGTVFARPLAVQFVGYMPDGSTVMTNFVTDGIIDGIGPLADFQTFHFGLEFSGLRRVEVPTIGWSLDNLALWRDVPEPGTGALLGLAAALLGVRSLRGKRSD